MRPVYLSAPVRSIILAHRASTVIKNKNKNKIFFLSAPFVKYAAGALFHYGAPRMFCFAKKKNTLSKNTNPTFFFFLPSLLPLSVISELELLNLYL